MISEFHIQINQNHRSNKINAKQKEDQEKLKAASKVYTFCFYKKSTILNSTNDFKNIKIV